MEFYIFFIYSITDLKKIVSYYLINKYFKTKYSKNVVAFFWKKRICSKKRANKIILLQRFVSLFSINSMFHNFFYSSFIDILKTTKKSKAKN